MRLRTVAGSFVALLMGCALLSGCADVGELGEACTTRGSEGECVSGTICSKDEADNVKCLLVCVEKEDCPVEFNCNGVSGSSIKSCQ